MNVSILALQKYYPDKDFDSGLIVAFISGALALGAALGNIFQFIIIFYIWTVF